MIPLENEHSLQHASDFIFLGLLPPLNCKPLKNRGCFSHLTTPIFVCWMNQWRYCIPSFPNLLSETAQGTENALRLSLGPVTCSAASCPLSPITTAMTITPFSARIQWSLNYMHSFSQSVTWQTSTEWCPWARFCAGNWWYSGKQYQPGSRLRGVSILTGETI